MGAGPAQCTSAAGPPAIPEHAAGVRALMPAGAHCVCPAAARPAVMEELLWSGACGGVRVAWGHINSAPHRAGATATLSTQTQLPHLQMPRRRR